jgi:UDP-N-acetylmuramoylalanine--D-glutamate ligase
MKTFKNKRISVIGFARSGKAVVKLLKKMNAKVFVSEIDKKKETNINDVESEFGKHTEKIYNSKLIVLSPGISSTHPVVKRAKKLGIPLIGELSFSSQFIEKNKIIAVTGTNGKTTTVYLIHKILEANHTHAVVCGNTGMPLSTVVEKRGDESMIYVLEVSSFQLEFSENFSPHIGVILNIKEDHLNRHKSFEEYKRLKLRLIANQKEKDFSILNWDDVNLRKVKTKGEIIYFSKKEKKDIWVEGGRIYFREKNLFPLSSLNILWQNWFPNYLAAIGVGMVLEVPPEVILTGLNNFKGLPHRMEEVGVITGVKFINNSMCTNPHSLSTTLLNFKQKIILIMGGKMKDLEFKNTINFINKKSKYVILIGEASEELDKLIKTPHVIAYSMREAVSLAYKQAKKGDIVLLSPGFASFDWFKDFRERGEVFKREVERIRYEGIG